jgi:uncharacterized protein (DUF2062 family)
MGRMMRRSTSPVEVLFTVMTGLFLGVFPVIGITSVFCAYAAHRFRMNHLLIQAANYLAFPLQLALLIPFIRLGEAVFRAKESMPYTLGQMLEMLGAEPLQVLGRFLNATLYAVGAWTLTVFPVMVFLIFWRRRRADGLKFPGRRSTD